MASYAVDILHEAPMADVHMDAAKAAELPARGENMRCPLCNSTVRLYYVNFHEKMLMCPELTCPFPFGHEDLKFVKVNEGLVIDQEVLSLISWSTDYLSRTSSYSRKSEGFDSDDSQSDQMYAPKHPKKAKRKQRTQEEKLKKHVEDIKVMNEKLERLKKGREKPEHVVGNVQIENERWIKNLEKFEKFSSVKLLQPGEASLLKKKQPPDFGVGELKIDITSVSDGSPIQINIINANNSPPSINPKDPSAV